MSSSVVLSALFLLLSASDPGSCEGELGPFLEPYDLLFDNAVEAYYKQDWLSVILNMERALKNKDTVRKVKTQCRLSCANLTSFQHPESGPAVPLPGAGPVQDLGFFQRVLKRAECVNRCEVEKLGPPSVHKISDEVQLEFRKRTPYNYLQVAYFKINKLDKAVAAANTFYIANPDHMEMRQNLEYYSMMAGVQETDFKDLEARPHMAEFLEGKRLYSADDFSSSIAHFETALEEFFVADAECRALCEGEYDYDGYNYMEYNADLFQSISDHYLYSLNCKQNCAVELASIAGSEKPLEDFLPSHLNYLQFSYYNSEQYEKAIECAKTFLLFRPDDAVMKQNLDYYSAVLGADKAAAITATEVVQQYIKNSLLEKELLYFGYEIFGITFVDPDSWTPEEIMPKKLRDKQKADRETAARITEEIGNLMKEIETLVEEKTKDASDITKMAKDGGSHEISSPEGGGSVFDGVAVSMAADALNGSLRAVLDGAITDDECRELHRLSNTAAQKGDGYRGRPSPHSPSEMFQGVTVLKALKLGQEGVLPLKSARLFFEISEKVRRVVESYFKLQSPLYFSYSHLVCRSAIEENQEDREDLSHPVHVDNCLLISELNECMKEPPAYTHRDYSAILYLNDDFEGGDFIFTELDAKTITAVVKPQCGRIVAFGAGKENPHGVRAVTKGQRCAVALWFTLDPRHNEKERIQAEELLKMLSSPLDAEFQRTEAQKDKNGETELEEDSVKPDGEKTAMSEDTKTPAEEQASKTTEEKTDASSDTKTDAKTDKSSDAKTDKSSDAKTDKSSDAKTDKSSDAKTDISADAKTDISADAKTDISADAKTDISADTKTDISADTKTDASSKTDAMMDTSADAMTDTNSKSETDTSADNPKTDTSADNPKTDTSADNPKTDTSADNPKTDTSADNPKTDTSADNPKTDTSADNPKTDTSADNPKTDTSADNPKTDTSADKPKTDTSADKPKTDTSADKPKTDTSADKPKTDTSADKPKTDTSADTKTNTNANKRQENTAAKKTTAKTAGKTKTKAKKAEKTKSKTTDIKKKPTVKKTAKTSSKKTDGKQPKAKSLKSDSQTEKEEL